MIVPDTDRTPIRVLIADDEELVRAGLRALISDEPSIEVVGEAADGAEAVSQSERLRPDVVCMDVRMPRVDGIAATRTIAARGHCAVLILTTFENDDYVYDALRAGAQGFLLKRAAPDAVVQAIGTVHRRDALLFPEAVRSLFLHARRRSPEVGLPTLSTRESEVLRLIARGRSNAEIAAELYLGVETVKSHVGSILTKLEVRDRLQAVIKAYGSGFVSVDRSTEGQES